MLCGCCHQKNRGRWQYRDSDISHPNKHGTPYLKNHGEVAKPERLPASIDIKNLNLSFGGCGYLGMYHIGVVGAFRTLIPEHEINKISGASAGAIVGALVLGNVPTDVMAEILMNGILESRAHTQKGFSLPYYINDRILERSISAMLPENIHELVRGKLFISATDLKTKKNVILSSFDSKKNLIDALLASSRIPFITGLAPITINQNKWLVDGGLSSNLPQFLDDVITVSPFSSNAHISPMDDSSTSHRDVPRLHFADQGFDLSCANMRRFIHVAFPPKKNFLSKTYEQGFKDAARFVRLTGLSKCQSCWKPSWSISSDSVCRNDKNCNESDEKFYSRPAFFNNDAHQPVWNLKDEIEEAKNNSKVHNFVNFAWTFFTFVSFVQLIGGIFGVIDYLENPGKVLYVILDWLSDFLDNLSPSNQTQDD